ncbi:MAG: DUF1800 domain-containing protein [Candidatus Acidiferrales bacterium]
MRRLLSLALALALLVPAPLAVSAKEKSPEAWKGSLPIRDLSEPEAILHALNRLAFGPRPGDVERVRALGLEKWIEQQLQPEKIDDSAVAQRLKRYPTLAMSSAELLEKYPRPQVAMRRAGMSREEIQQMQEQRQKQRQELEEMRQQMESGEATPEMRERLREMRALRDGDDAQGPQRVIAELSAAKLTRAIYSERQLEEMLVDFWFNHFNVFAGKGADRWLLTSYERDAIRPHVLGNFHAMLHATAKSPAMLFYLDNWQSADPEAFARMEGELRRRRDRFQRLFGDNPEMMEQMRRRDPNSARMQQRDENRRARQMQAPGPGQPGQQAQRRQRGLNENYARELMELHTLGVDGGYTQQDIIEVARAFTGWTMRPRSDAKFYFEPRIHDAKPKTVLGKKIDAGGVKDGEAILDMLARHPNTARFVSTKLARRFVSDTPPEALVQRMAQSFAKSDGDIRAVVRAMIYSPEFWSRDVYRAKIKKPVELIASTARALGAESQTPLPLVQWANRIGEPLYRCQPPTGYSDKSEAWVNTGALLNRLNFALALAGNRLRGTRVNVASLLGSSAASSAERALEQAIEIFLAGQISEQTRATLAKQLSDPQVTRATLDDRVQRVDAGVIAGLVLGSPEFQRR